MREICMSGSMSGSERPAYQTNMVERNGHPIHHIYNSAGNLLFKEEYVTLSAVPQLLKSYCRYNQRNS